MINFLIGPPRAGKSYEAVVYHVLPALAAGRKVITNLPINVLAVADINPDWADLLDIRKRTRAAPAETDWSKAEQMFKRFGIVKKTPPFIDRVFANVDDYGDKWRHPKTGTGPLYVIDECHFCLPFAGTPKAVEEWFSMHGHETADVLLISQSFGKVNKNIRDMVQTVYRVRKASAMGLENSYIRKVQDGPRGEVVNQAVRKYKPEFFPLYQSHTLGGGAEQMSSDIKPIYKNWSFIGAGVCFGVLAVGFATGLLKNPLAPSSYSVIKPAQQTTAAKPQAATTHHVATTPPPPAPTPAVAPPVEPEDPFKNRGLHLLGSATFNGVTLTRFAVSQNGQGVTVVDLRELISAGYSWESFGECSGVLRWGRTARPVLCDSPQVGAITTLGS